MPFGTQRVAATYAREILRVVNGSEVAENAVVNGLDVALDANNRRVLESGQVMVYAGVNEQQKIVLSGVDAGDTFTLTWSGQTTSAITALNVTPETIQAALEALSNIGVGDIDVQGSPGGPFQVTFTGALAAADQAAITATPTGCTVTITTTRAGAAAAAGAGQKVKPAPSSGISASLVAGILMHTTEFFGGPGDTPKYGQVDEPVALFTKNCNFATAQLLSYSGNAAAVKSAMTGAGNDKCANCTFEA